MSKPTFDPAAEDYDQSFTNHPTARWLRARVHERLNHNFKSGNTVLELGCGTGEDALYLAQRGINVTATDASPKMLNTACAKTAHLPNVTFAHLDMRRLPQNDFMQQFDGAYSNFGALNCLQDWQPLAKWLAERLKSGSTLGFGVMNPFCLWEIGWHSLHLNFKTAFRRFRRQNLFQLNTGEAINITYPSVNRLKREFAPYFDFVTVKALGVFLPPSDIYGVIEKRPRFYHTLINLEKALANYHPLKLTGDHYWIEFRKI